MLNILYELSGSNSFVSLYTNCNSTGNFYFGRILAVDKNEIAIQTIHTNGLDDGVVVMPVDNVFRVECDGQYSSKMKKLINLKCLPQYALSGDEKGIMSATLKYVHSKKHIVSIELCNSDSFDIVGYIDSIDDNECTIKQVDRYGCYDGLSYVKISNITMLSFLAEEEKIITKLVEMKNNTGNDTR